MQGEDQAVGGAVQLDLEARVPAVHRLPPALTTATSIRPEHPSGLARQQATMVSSQAAPNGRVSRTIKVELNLR